MHTRLMRMSRTINEKNTSEAMVFKFFICILDLLGIGKGLTEHV
jgi:hypothetical protein